MPSPRRRPATTARALAAASGSLLLLFLLLGTPAAREDPPLAITSSALLVLDPDPNDPCFAAPQACVESCASVLRVDVLRNGNAYLTPSGPDYTLSCDTGFKSDDPGFRTYWEASGIVQVINVTCAKMSASGFEVVWPPLTHPSLAPDSQKPALAFDSFNDLSPGRRSFFNKPDERVDSAVFARSAYHDALCHPWHCPTPGCSYMKLFPLLVLRAAEPGSGRIDVISTGRHFGGCLERRLWQNDSSCTDGLGSVRYRILEGRLLNETAAARPKPGNKPSPCPPGTCPRKIFVPPAPGVGDGGNQSTVKAGPRDAVCVSACDGGGKANATARAIEYASAPPQNVFDGCPTNAKSNVGFECKPGCLSWQGPCCAAGSTPGPSADCPACPRGAHVDIKQPVARARLRLASIVAPNATAACTNLTRFAALDLMSARGHVMEYPLNQLAVFGEGDPKRSAFVGCPARELVLSITADCGVRLSSSSSSCWIMNTTTLEDENLQDKVLTKADADSMLEGVLGTLPFTLAPGVGGAAGAAQTIKERLLTRYWHLGVQEQDRASGQYYTRWMESNMTVAALEANGPGGRGLLALRLNPVGCIYRYVVVEGELPGASGSAPVAAAAGAGSGVAGPLPAAARWCPGGTTKSPDPAKLPEPGEPVPVCVMTKQ